MLKRTFSDVKTELARVAGQTGMTTTDVRVRELTTLAQERLCIEGEWAFQYARLKFRQHGSIVSLPTEYEALVHTTLEREPLNIQPSWFEFLEFGPGPTDQSKWANLGIDLGESPVFRNPGIDGATVTIRSTDGADTGSVVVTGYDVDGVRRVVTFALPDTTSDVRWSKIVQVTKPITVGDVVLSYSDLYGEESVAATYRYRDTTPSFRQYRVPIGDADCKVIHAVARRRVFPIRADEDELFVTNLPALRLGVKAVAFEDSGKIDASEATFAIARSILSKEAALYKAGQNAVPVNVRRISALSTRPDIY